MLSTSRLDLWAVTFVAAVCAPGARAQSNVNTQTASVTWGGEADFNYRYLWQGLAYSRGPVFQPSVWVSAKDFTLTLWGNQVLNNEPYRGELTEYSLSLDYSATVAGWTIEPDCEKWVNRYPHSLSSPNTSIAAVKIAHKAGPVSLFTDQSVDINSYLGAYWGDAGAAWEKQLGRVKFAGSSSAGWASSKFNEAYIGVTKNALDLITAEFSATFSLPAHAYLRPHVEFSSIVDRQLRASLASPTLWNTGLAFGFSF